MQNNLRCSYNHSSFPLYIAYSSGTSETCVSETVGVERMARVTEWMREHGYQTILGEFGGGANQLCYTAMRNLLGEYSVMDIRNY